MCVCTCVSAHYLVNQYFFVLKIALQFPIFYFTASTARQRVVVNFKSKYKSVKEAEDHLGLTVENYINSDPPTSSPATFSKRTRASGHLSLTKAQQMGLAITFFTSMDTNEKYAFLEEVVPSLPCSLLQKVIVLVADLPGVGEEHLLDLTQKLFLKLAKRKEITSNPADFVPLSLEGMKKLEDLGKANLIYKFSQSLAKDREGTKMPLLPVDRMPFGLIDYVIQFYTCTDARQASIVIYFCQLKWGQNGI